MSSQRFYPSSCIDEATNSFGRYLIVDIPETTTREVALIDDHTVAAGISEQSHPVVRCLRQHGYEVIETE